MLVLTRKPGETIRIGDDITLTVLEVDGNNIKLGIQAPKAVAVYREEVYQRILEENKIAVQVSDSDLQAIGSLFRKGKQEK